MTSTLKEKIDALPEPLQSEVEGFVDALVAEREQRPRPGFSFSWAGGLAHLKKEFTSVELQHSVRGTC